MDRYTRNKDSYYKKKLETDLLQEEYDSGVEFVNRLHRERLKLSELMELESRKQADLKEKIQFLQGESGRVQKAIRTKQKLIEKIQNESAFLEVEAQVLEEATQKQESLKQSQTVKNNFPELIVYLNRGDLPTEKSILLTCFGRFIRTMAENEFEEHAWTAKVAENNKGVAGRIRFDGVFMSETDIKLIYKPIISELGKRFSRSGLAITTKTKRSNGVVTALDVTIRVPSRIREARLELP
tara:strand:- start:330 stop:1049 length:720 start_codon:yes stop_codon:yes gene_type:complete